MTAWSLIVLSEVLTPISRREAVVATHQYRLLGAHWYAEGLYIKDTKSGSEIQATQVYRVEAGDFVYNRLFAWKGSFALAGTNVDGCYVSNEFPCFRVREDRIDGRYLQYYFSRESAWNEALGLSSGGTPTSRNRLKEERLLAITIPLPSLQEQRRIVERINWVKDRVVHMEAINKSLTGGIKALNGSLVQMALRGEIRSDDTVPTSSFVSRLFQTRATLIEQGQIKRKDVHSSISETEKYCETPATWEWVRLGDLCSVITDGTHQTPRYLDQGMMFLSAQNVKPFRFMPKPCKYVSPADFTMYTAQNRAVRDDILITRVGAMIGEAALVDQDLDFAIYVSVGLLKPLHKFVYAPYLVDWLNSPDGAAHSRRFTLGKGHSQGNLNLNLLRRFPIPLPPLAEQRRISIALDATRSKFQWVYSAKCEVESELGHIIPSVLAQAFSGRL